MSDAKQETGMTVLYIILTYLCQDKIIIIIIIIKFSSKYWYLFHQYHGTSYELQILHCDTNIPVHMYYVQLGDLMGSKVIGSPELWCS